jgi:hypothetical protein
MLSLIRQRWNVWRKTGISVIYLGSLQTYRGSYTFPPLLVSRHCSGGIQFSTSLQGRSRTLTYLSLQLRRFGDLSSLLHFEDALDNPVVSCFTFRDSEFVFIISYDRVKLSSLGSSASSGPIISSPDYRWALNWRWNENWQKKNKYSKKTHPSDTLSTTIPMWLDLGRRSGKPATTSHKS